MTRTAGLALLSLLLAACGSEEERSAGPSSASTTASTVSATARASTSSSPNPADARLDQAIAICTDGLEEPDTVLYDAVHAARAGSRSVSEIAAAFRQAQDSVEGLAAEAEAADHPGLSQSLQEYADVLGRARVSGDAGLTEIVDAREAIDAACLMSAADQ